MEFTISFILYTLAIVGIGLYSLRFTRRSDEDYFLAGRTLGPWVASLSASASSMSGWVTLGLVGMAFASGFRAYWIVPGCMLGFLFNWFVMAGPMRTRAAEVGALTIPDFLAFHFRERWPIVRLMSVLVIFAAMLVYVAAQFASAGLAFEAAFGMEYWLGVVIGAVIVIIYTVVGGFRAACWTDFIQALMMVGALLLMPIVVLIDLGGWTFVQERFQQVDPGLNNFMPQQTGLALIGFLLGSGALGINLGYPGQPHILVRFMGMRDARDAKLGGVIANVWALLLLWGAITLGILVRAMAIDGAEWAQPLADQLASDAEGAAETAMVLSAKHLLHGVLGGMVLAAVVAALASTADSQLVVAASAAANDIYARLMDKTGKGAHPWINRAVVFALGVGAALVVLFDKVGIYKFVLGYGWAIPGAAFGPQLILLLLWKRASYAGCVAGMISGFASALIWPFVWNAEAMGVEVYNLTAAFVIALGVNIVVSLIKPDRARD